MDPSIIAAAAAVALRLPQSRVDRGEDPAIREARVRRVVAAAVEVSRTRYELALMLADADAETHLASHVVDGHCERMPAGERCDNGRSRGVWQVRDWCKKAYAFAAGSDESMLEEARCALGQMHHGWQVCRAHAQTPFHGGFAALAARPCSWAGADRRVKLAYRIDAALEREGVAEPAASARR